MILIPLCSSSRKVRIKHCLFFKNELTRETTVTRQNHTQRQEDTLLEMQQNRQEVKSQHLMSSLFKNSLRYSFKLSVVTEKKSFVASFL